MVALQSATGKPVFLARELDRATESGTRQSLAAKLIQWGDLRALPALFRYVKSGSQEDARPDALYFVCRRVDAESTATVSLMARTRTRSIGLIS